MANFNENVSLDVNKHDMVDVIRELRQRTGTIESTKSLNELTESINSVREENIKLKSQTEEKYNTIKKLEAELKALQENESKATSLISGLGNGKLVILGRLLLLLLFHKNSIHFR